MITRRRFMKLMGGGFLGSMALGGYAFAIEPLYSLKTTFLPPQTSELACQFEPTRCAYCRYSRLQTLDDARADTLHCSRN